MRDLNNNSNNGSHDNDVDKAEADMRCFNLRQPYVLPTAAANMAQNDTRTDWG
jgi:hypothetical protein